jgi:hypothetical protein
MEKNNLGIYKKSFSMPFQGGEIWFEHLDAIHDENMLRGKFIDDMKTICKPSTSSFLAINLDETEVNYELLDFLMDQLISMEKPLRKVVFIGLDLKMRRYIRKKRKNINFLIHFLNDFEEAKIWLMK